ncbi:MAG TPA: hypothetical protein DET40_14315 [Lentisphaeria bacterium]|nr:MAG: hypothetical protein A2X45_05490 [Lentisphaerae bacterium GWF2_50_93]HCE44712.1 hypothetical protein [Lentisphaeria bacterium]
MKYLLNSLLLISAVFCFTLSAGNLTLVDGKVLENAFVMSERPDGLEIGHKGGVMFVGFTNLPESLQKKYNYNPDAAAKYVAQVAELKEKRKKVQEQQKAEQAKAFAENQKRTSEMQYEQLGLEIQQCQARIAFLKPEIPRLEQKYTELLSKSSQMMLDNPVMNQTVSGGNYCWNGGFLTTGGGQATVKKKAIKQITDEAADAKETLGAYTAELQEKENKLIIMKNAYEKMKAQKAAGK